jgi:hypothetical protein
MLLPHGIPFTFIDYLSPDKVTPEAAAAASEYIEAVRKYYIKYYNNANDQKDALLAKLEAPDKAASLKLKNDYYNTSLEEFVLNKNEADKITEYKGELIQKMDPIFMDPKNKFIRAHFYSPTKQIFGIFVDTYTVNVIVLWVMTIVLYLALYFRLLKKLLDSGEVAMGKKMKGSD